MLAVNIGKASLATDTARSAWDNGREIGRTRWEPRQSNQRFGVLKTSHHNT